MPTAPEVDYRKKPENEVDSFLGAETPERAPSDVAPSPSPDYRVKQPSNEVDSLLGSEAPKVENDVDDFLDGESLGKDLNAAVQYGAEKNPEQAQRVLRLQKQFDLPEAVIDRNADKLENKTRVESVNTPEFAKSSPIIAEWLKQSPYRTAATWNDLPRLGKIEDFFKRPQELQPMPEAKLEEMARRYAKSQAGKSEYSEDQHYRQRLSELRWEEAFIAGEDPVGAFELTQKRSRQNIFAAVPLAHHLIDLGNSKEIYDAAVAMTEKRATPEQVERLTRLARLEAAQKYRGTTFGADVASMVGSSAIYGAEFAMTGGAYNRVKSLFYTKGALEAAKGVVQKGMQMALQSAGWVAGSAAQAAVIAPLAVPGKALEKATPPGSLVTDEQGNVTYTVSQQGKPFSQTIPKAAAEHFNEIASERMGGLLKFVGGPVTKRIAPYLEKWVTNPANKFAIGRWFSTQTESAAAKAFGALMEKGGFNGLPAEVFEERMNDAMNYLTGVTDTFELPSASQLAAEVTAFSIPGAAHAGINAVTRAQSQADSFKKFGDNIKESEIFQKAPEVMEQIIEHTSGGTRVIAPLESWITYWQDQGKEPADVAEEVIGEGGREAYEEARRNGTDLAIPYSRYAITIAPSEHNGFWHKELRRESLDRNVREANEELELKIQEESKRAETESPQDGLRQSIDEYLVATNYDETQREQFAQTLESRVRARAKIRGQDPLELFNAEKQTIVTANDAVVAPEILEQPDIPEGDELEYLRARVKQLETELRTSDLTGLRNKKAFDEDEQLGWTATAALDMDGLKRLNDFIGHDMADQVLKALGGYLLKSQGEGDEVRFYHRSGDEFAARFKNPEQADAFMARIQGELDKLPIYLYTSEGRELLHDGIGVSYGTGQNYEEADLKAIEQKEQRLREGKREDSRSPGQPRRLREVRGIKPPSGGEDSGGVGGQTPPEVLEQSARPLAPPFYSKLQRVLEEKMPNSATVDQVRGLIKDVKEEEKKWSGIDDFLKGKTKVSKEELLAFLRANQLEVKEVTKGGASQEYYVDQVATDEWGILRSDNGEVVDRGFADEDTAKNALEEQFPVSAKEATKFGTGNLVLPGGENYKEILFTLPGNEFAGPHFDEKGVIAHARISERTGEASGAVESQSNQVTSDGLAAHAKTLSDFVESKAFRSKGLNGLGVEDRAAVQASVLAAIGNAQVLRAIVESVPVDVMDDIARAELTPEEFFGDKTMLADSLSANANALVRFRAKSLRALVSAVADLAAKEAATSSELIGLSVQGNSAPSAGRVEAGHKQERILFIEEIQSDLHQAGRKKGYGPQEYTKELQKEHSEVKARLNKAVDAVREEQLKLTGKTLDFFEATKLAVSQGLLAQKDVDRHLELRDISDGKFLDSPPDAPFRKTWHEFVLKRLIRYAAENGFDKVAWTTGEQQAERYDLSKKIGKLELRKDYGARMEVWAYDLDGDKVFAKEVADESQLSEIVGKEATEKLNSKKWGKPSTDGTSIKSLSGLDLKVGGEGMKGFYDKIIPDFLRKFGKKFGATVGQDEVSAPVLGNTPEDLVQWRQSIETIRQQEEEANSLSYKQFPEWDTTGGDIPVKPHPSLPIKIYDFAEQDRRFFVTWGEREEKIGEYQDLAGLKARLRADTAVFLNSKITTEEANLEKAEQAAGTKVHSIPITPALKDAALNQGFELFQPGGEGPRGSFDRMRNVLTLGAGKDLSTFLHESGHIWLEEMGRDYDFIKQSAAATATFTPEQQQFINDADTILKWLGVSAFSEIERKHHEKFAKGTELYFMEGKAPTKELEGPFARFRVWLTELYQAIKDQYFEGIEISSEVRGVFDRLVATQEQIQSAQAQQNMQTLFPAELQADVDAARHQAETELSAKVMQDLRRVKTKEWKEKRDAIRADVEKEINARPEYIALSVLQRGTFPDGSAIPQSGVGELLETLTGIKLSKAAIVAQFGEERLKKLPKPYVYSRAGGINPDDAAPAFGYGSGDELLTALETAPDRVATIEAETDRRMKAENGDMLRDGTIAQEAMRVVHSDKRAQLLRRELEILQSQFPAAAKGIARRLVRPLPTTDEIRFRAETEIGKKRVRDINPFSYQRAEARAAKEAMDLFQKGDLQGAYDAKERELLNHELYRAAVAAKDNVDQIVTYMQGFGKLSTRARLGKAGHDYLDQIDAILDRFDFRKSVSGKALDRRKSLRDWLKAQAEDGLTVDVPEKLQNEAYRQHYKDTAYDELVEVKNTVQQIAHLARLKNELLANELVRDLEEAETKLVSTIEAHHKIDNEPEDFTPSLRDKFKSGMREHFAEHTRMEFFFEFLDGGKAHGPIWQMLFQPFAAAEDREAELAKNDATVMRAIWSAYSKKERAQMQTEKTFYPGLKTAKASGNLTKAEVIALALNWGNEYNRQGLLEGYGWTELQVKDVLDTLDARDVKTVNAIWAHIDSYWESAKDLQQHITGIAPEKVQGMPYTLKGGVLSGGYYPIKFDNQRSFRQLQLDEKSALGESFAHATRAMTRHGHLIERTSTGGKPFLLNLSVVSDHLNQVRHDVTHRRALIDVSRILARPKVREAIEGAAGREMYRQLNPWLKGIAGDVPTEASGRWEKFLSRMRSGATVVNLGLKVTSGIAQTLGFLSVVDEIGLKYAARGLKDVVANPMAIKKNWAFVSERSTMMANRLNNFDRDIRDLMKKHGPMDEAQAAWFYHIGFMDLALSVPAWLGAYEKAMEGAVENIGEADEKSAIEYADSVVRKTMAAGSAKDLAAVQRGGEIKRLFTAFYSQLSIQFNLLQRTGQNFGLTSDKAKLISSLAVLWFLPAVLNDLVKGRGPDDEEEWYAWALKKMGYYPLQTLVGIRDIVSAVEWKVNTGQKANFTPTPAIQAVEALIDAVTPAVTKPFTGEEYTRKDAKAAALAVGYFAKLPTRQVWQTGEYMYDWMTGEVQPDNAVQGLWQALVSGKPRP